MTRPTPAHGTVARRFGCKSRPPCLCHLCVQGARRKKKATEFRRSQGFEALTLCAPVAAHVRRLVASGRSLAGIARDSGLSVDTTRRVMGEYTEKIWKSTADSLMSVPEEQDKDALVDSTGTVRRLRALVVMGHPQKVLAAEVGCAFTYISMLTHGQRAHVTVALEQSVRRVYGLLSMTLGPSTYGRNRALGYGWYGPLAWDDDTIDDPKAMPQTDAFEPVATDGGNVAARWLLGESVILGPADRREVLQHLFEWTNDTITEIAARLDMTPQAAEQAWVRMKKKAALEGRRLWRRAYVPRERTLNQNQMEEAA